MKLQGLAVIFIIIVIPITIVIGEYASTQIEIFRLEQTYDSRLITATHDALKAFQINTFNDVNSGIADRKLSSIEASANAFYNALESSFELEGYSKENLKMYVPALVYTMYDGYYIYSPYRNVADITEGNGQVHLDLNSEKIEYGFKPYVYYSCRYVKDNIDVIINYSLDNYITVQGTIGEEAVYKSGYLHTIADTKDGEGIFYEKNEKKYYYSGIEILVETNLSDYLIDKDATGNLVTREYKYIKLNGIKYYLNEKDDDGDGLIDEYFFYIKGGNRAKQVTKSANEEDYYKYLNQMQINTSAISYYRSAYEFTKWVNEKLGSLEPKHAKIDDDTSGVKNSSTEKIFANKQIEYSKSNFNLHRKEVIRYSIESNLSVAIANFNSYSNSTNDFQMPKIKENEWELLENEISIISFLQGLSLGGKIYNGYTVVTNDKTEEVVKEERIYINVDETGDGEPDYYHKVNDEHFTNEFSDGLADEDIIAGVLDLDFELRKDGATGYSYTQKKQLACYASIVGQERVNNKYDSIYEYLQKELDDNSDGVLKKTKQLYYTALGRERWGTYKIENSSNLGDLLSDMLPMNNYDIVTDGLIRFYHGENVDGQGNVGNEGTTVWQDLSGNYDAILINGPKSNTNGYITFDGINDWANCGVVDLDYATINLKIELLKDYAGGSNSYYLFNNWETNKTGLGFLIRPNGQLHFEFYDELSGNHSVSSGVIMQPNKIYDITGTFDGSQIKLYINGILKQVQSASGKINGPKDNTVLGIAVNTDGSGVDTWSKYANMNVHSVKVYDRALTEEEVVQNYNAMK